MSLDLNAIAEEILVAHQRHKGGCLCGWSELGKSHPGHQVAMLCEAGIWNDCAEARAELARYAERLDRADQLVAKYAPIAVPILADIKARKERAARMAAHTHYCWTCSDGDKPGDGCHNCRNTGMDQTPCVGCPGPQPAAEPSGETDLDPNAPPIEAVLHVLGDVIAPDEPTGRTRCPLCKTLPIGHEGECEP